MRVRLFSTTLVTTLVGLLLLLLPGPEATAHGRIVDLCLSTVSASEGCVFVCPAGDGQTLADRGAVIDVTILDDYGEPIVGIPASDFWVIGCEDNLVLCGGSASINADGPTDGSGHTTISGTIRERAKRGM